MGFNLADVLGGVSNLDTGREQIEYIKLDLIDADPNNFYQLSGVEDLAANIQLCGLQQPIRLRKHPETAGRYIIVSGHRRREAILMLAKDDPDKWKEVPCIIEADDVPAALQQLRLIFANSSTRKMSDAELSEQAVQVEKLLYQLKEEGYEFPGRMRDHVAKAVNASKTKLARLKVIRDGLAAAWQPVWKDGTLTENAAYELARIPKAYQSLLFEEKSRTGANLGYLYADDVKKYYERATAINRQKCKACGGECSNYENKMRKAAVAERWGWFYCDNKCCRDCPELLRCQRACPRLQETVKQLKADAKAAAKQKATAKAASERPQVDRISALWQRFGLAREMAFQTFDDCKQATNLRYFSYDADKVMRLECGEEKVTPDTKLPYDNACYLSSVDRLVALAELFNCSIDYLLCRTDVKEMAQAAPAVSESGTIWHPISEEPPTGVDLVWLDARGYSDTAEYKGGGKISIVSTIPWEEARYWAYLPKEET